MKKDNIKKISLLQVVLTVVYVTALLISNVITNRQIELPFNIAVTGGIIIFPLTYILSDLFSEVYGYKWSRITCYLGFAMNLLMVIVFTIVINAPAPIYFDGVEAYHTVLGNTPRILIASLMAFMLGDFVNDRVFKKMKEKHGDMKGFKARAILSSLFGEITDSVIFYPIAFAGIMDAKTILTIAATEVVIKVGYECLIIPITTILTKKTMKHEGR